MAAFDDNGLAPDHGRRVRIGHPQTMFLDGKL